MYRMIKKKAVGCVLLLAMIVTMFSQSSLTAEAVKVSDMDYTVSLNGSYVYIGNEIPGPIEIGQEYYMTYTVQSAPVASMKGATFLPSLLTNSFGADWLFLGLI